MINISVVTGTRADYGLLFWLLKGLKEDNAFNLEIVATGSHLSELHGDTYKFIEKDGFEIKEKISILTQKDDSTDIAKSTANAIVGFSDYFDRSHVDIVLILGDRYEALAAASAALFSGIPIMHIHGGEVTSGAYDDMMRHAITKMSHFHCTTNEEHMKRVIQLGENPKNVKNFGAPGLEGLKKSRLISKEKLSEKLKFELRNFFICTYHPETLSNMSVDTQIKNLLHALDEFPNRQVLFTYPNADDGGRKIIEYIEEYVSENSQRCFASSSLGQINYYSALSYCDLIVGNSSSGIIEAASAKVPSVNIGDRQLNRSAANSVINSKNSKNDIVKAIKKGLSENFKNKKNIYNNPYGEGKTSEDIISWLKSIDFKDRKIFYDLKR